MIHNRGIGVSKQKHREVLKDARRNNKQKQCIIQKTRCKKKDIRNNVITQTIRRLSCRRACQSIQFMFLFTHPHNLLTPTPPLADRPSPADPNSPGPPTPLTSCPKPTQNHPTPQTARLLYPTLRPPERPANTRI